MESEPIAYIDFDALRANVADYDSLFLKLLRLFLEQAPQWIDELKMAFASEDPVLIRQLCHKIKGGAGTLQANAIIEAVADLGRQVEADDPDRVEEGRRRLLNRIEQTIAYVRASGYIQS